MKRVDFILFLVPIVINGFALWILYHGNTDLFTRQLCFSFLGIILMIVVAKVHYLWWIRFSNIFYILGLGLLVAVLFFGREVHGARSWLNLGSVHLQPSELMKIILCLTLIQFLKRADHFHPWLMAAVAAIPLVLVLAQPDLGSAAVLTVIALMAFLLSPLSLRTLFYTGLTVITIVIMSWFFMMKPYQKQRLLTFFFPERAPANYRYQVQQSLIAIGSGGITGKGVTESSQGQLRFLPAQYTDFIFAVFAEQRGFLGVVLLLALYLLYLNRILTVSRQIGGIEGRLLGMLLFSFLFFHLGYNAGMVAALVPITGIPIPFLSYGGSFLITCYAATGLALNLSANRFGSS